MSEEMRMTVSGKVKDKNGKPAIYVTFEDEGRFAEGEAYSGEIRTSKGFSDKELEGLRFYLLNNTLAIEKMALEVNPMKAFLK
ncbi:hypothetical protein [Butyrivibrio sp. MC2013]|uniref:hypothetical protein n=1 Tax=Butyrivibrio sp. MC2013 TaxID=1280686 RepID=UPI0003FB383E|nr:hypothetical protein [Butyrivibrio sp. MC2013]